MGFDALPKGWKVEPVSALAGSEKYSCVGGPFGSNLTTKDYVEYEGVPVSRGTNLKIGSRVFIDENFVYVSKEKAKKLEKNSAGRGDIILTQRGTIGQVAFIPESSRYERYILSQNQMKITLDSSKVNMKYFLYYFLSKKVQDNIQRIVIGGVIPGFNLTQFREFEVVVPPLDYQNEIVATLDSLDSKIELNRQTNQTLEQMAQALFKSWFVDFDPVIDNALAAGNPIPAPFAKRAEIRKALLDKTLPEEQRALFPSEFEETERSNSAADTGDWVPKGWSVASLESLANALSGFAFKSKDFIETGEAVIKIKNIKADRSVDIEDTNKVSLQVALIAEKYQLNDGDLVIAMTGATVGKFGIIVSEEQERYYLNQRVCKLTSHSKNGNVFLFAALNKPGFEEGIVDAAQGSAQPNISASAILATPMTIPSDELINLYISKMTSNYEKRINLKKQEYKLTKLRDTLLPKLISGELRLPETDSDNKQTSDTAA